MITSLGISLSRFHKLLQKPQNEINFHFNRKAWYPLLQAEVYFPQLPLPQNSHAEALTPLPKSVTLCVNRVCVAVVSKEETTPAQGEP